MVLMLAADEKGDDCREGGSSNGDVVYLVDMEGESGE
jgi:hypothetical protein